MAQVPSELGAYFTENIGQLDDGSWRYYAAGRTMAVAFGDGAFAYKVVEAGTTEGCLVEVRLVGAARAAPMGIGLLAHPTNYLIGNDPQDWVRGARSYKEIAYTDAWGEIDIRFTLDAGQLKYMVEVPPGSDPSRVGFEFIGVEGLQLDVANGDLLLGTPLGAIRDHAPTSFQETRAGRVSVPVGFQVRDDGIVGFRLSDYDTDLPLMIDPALKFSTFLGGSGEDQYPAIAVDAQGNSYVTGYTTSTNFPTTRGAYNRSNEGQVDGFVVKLNANGTGLVYATYLGGADDDSGAGISVDGSGNAFVTGATASTDFPTTSRAYDRSLTGPDDLFLLKLNPAGSDLIYSTFIGGSGNDYGNCIDVDASGCAYVSGSTTSNDFPTSKGAIDTSFNGNTDVIVLKVNSGGTALNYSTYLGGSSYEYADGIAIDALGRAVIAGSTLGTYPTTSGAYDTSFNGFFDCIVSMVNETGESLSFSTYVGGSNLEHASDVTLDDHGSVYVVGQANGNTFPTTRGAFDTTHNGVYDVVVFRLDDNGTKLGTSTFLGGSSNDLGEGIDVDSVGRVYVTGCSQSTGYPTTSGAYDTSHNGAYDMVLSVLNNDLNALGYSTYMGSTSDDWGLGVCVMGGPEVHIVASTESTGFPTTTGAYDTSHNGNTDLAVLKIVPAIGPFMENRSSSSATTGDNFTFETYVSDRVDVNRVWAEYWYGNSMTRTSSDLTRVSGTAMQGTWRLNITVPAHSLEALHYRLWASDVSKFVNGTDPTEVAVTDNDRPEMSDQTSGEPETGNDFTLWVNVTDNIAVRSVSVLYYFGTAQPVEAPMDAFKVTSSGNGTYSYVVHAPIYSRGPLFYNFSTIDIAGNRNSTAVKGIAVRDIYLPTFQDDGSNVSATTGEPFSFRIDVADNVGIAEVRVDYTIQDVHVGPMPLDPLNVDDGGNGTYQAVITIAPDATGRLNYTFTAIDVAGNANTTGTMGREITDNDLPEIIADLSDTAATTGDPFTFRLEVVENVAIALLRVEFWFEGPVNQGYADMTATGTPDVYEHTGLTIPANMTLPLVYRFVVSDLTGNVNETQARTIPVRDNDVPSFGADGTGMECVKGHDLAFAIEVVDNVGLAGVHLILWYGTGERTNITMTGSDQYGSVVTVPRHPAGDLHYLFAAADEAGNWNHTETRSRQATNLPPTITHSLLWDVLEGVRSYLDLTPYISDGNDGLENLTFDCDESFKSDEAPFTIVALYTEWVEAHDVWVTLTDGEATFYGNVTVRVTNVNDEPIVTSTPQGLAYVNQTYTYEVQYVDPDPMDVITFKLLSPPAGMTVSEDGLVIWTPTRSQHDWHWITLVLSDGTVDVEHRWQILVHVPDVEPGNRPPVPMSEPPGWAVKGQPLSWQWVVTDPDGDVLRFHLVVGPVGAVMNNTTGLLEWDVPQTAADNATFRLSVTDGVNVVPLNFIVAVRPAANRPPVIAGIIPDQKLRAEGRLDLTGFMTDPDDPVTSLTWRVEGGDSALFTTSLVNGVLVITPVKGAKGNATLTLFLEDPLGDFDSQDIDVSVEPRKTDDSAGSLGWIFLIVLVVVVGLILAKVAGSGRKK